MGWWEKQEQGGGEENKSVQQPSYTRRSFTIYIKYVVWYACFNLFPALDSEIWNYRSNPFLVSPWWTKLKSFERLITVWVNKLKISSWRSHRFAEVADASLTVVEVWKLLLFIYISYKQVHGHYNCKKEMTFTFRVWSVIFRYQASELTVTAYSRQGSSGSICPFFHGYLWGCWTACRVINNGLIHPRPSVHRLH